MKKYLFLVATLLLTVSMSVSAQRNQRNTGNRADNGRSEQIKKMTPKERADLMAKELDLTAEQTTQVQAMCEKQDAERLEQVNAQRSERGTGTQNRDARREEFREMREKEMQAQHEDLVKIIGKEKADKWNELSKDVRDTNRTGRRNPQNSNK